MSRGLAPWHWWVLLLGWLPTCLSAPPPSLRTGRSSTFSHEQEQSGELVPEILANRRFEVLGCFLINLGSKFWWRYKLDSIECGHRSAERPAGIAALRDCRFYIRGYSVLFALFRVQLQAQELGFLKKNLEKCVCGKCAEKRVVLQVMGARIAQWISLLAGATRHYMRQVTWMAD